jgi:hypothetical protein
MMLLSDGTVMAEGGNVDNTWYKLTPDSTGSYVNGTWSQLASMHVARLTRDAKASLKRLAKRTAKP